MNNTPGKNMSQIIHGDAQNWDIIKIIQLIFQKLIIITNNLKEIKQGFYT